MDRENNLLYRPWRELGNKTYEELKKEIVTHELTEGAGIEYINVLLVGQIGAGKSSFFNSVESVFEGYVTDRANAGTVEKSLTTQYRQYLVSHGCATDSSSNYIKFRFCDSMGLEGGKEGLDAQALAKIMDGHVKDQAELQGASFIHGRQGYKDNPDENDRIHCVVIVINSEQVSTMDDELIDKIKEVRKEADLRHLHPLIVLTRIDSLCQDTENNTENAFRSKSVRDKVIEVSGIFGIKVNLIQPVRNYDTQQECDSSMDTLILRALRQILRHSKDYLKDVIARQEGNSAIEVKTSNKWKAKEEYNCGGAPGLLNLTAGDLVTKIGPEKDGWVEVKNRGGQKGSVPVEKLVDPTKIPPKQWKAIQRYESRGAPGQLSLSLGETVTKIKSEQNGWVSVRNSAGQEGFVPSTFLVELTVTASASASASKKLQAKMDYDSQGALGQVSLSKGEFVTQLDSGNNDNWIQVRKHNGQRGSVPSYILG